MIPVSNELNLEARNFQKGNFGLWFSKFIDIDSNSGKPTGEEKAKERILAKYDRIISNNNFVSTLLQSKHDSQINFQKRFQGQYIPIEINAQLISRLVIGLGQTHPTETGIILDHNMGIPYIPAASVKGLVRAARRLDLGLDDESQDCNEDTLIPSIFGCQEKMGKVIFMDAYPAYIPDMEMDIMTPHYNDYYNGNEWPGDWMKPIPIKFFTVAKDTVFIFRALVDKKESAKRNGELKKIIEETYISALTQEGVGGKTSLGYGRFKIIKGQSKDISSKDESALFENTEYLEKNIFNFYDPPDGSKEYYLNRLTIGNVPIEKVQWLFQHWERNEKWNKDKEIAQAFLPLIPKYKKKGNKETHFYKVIKTILNT